MIREKVDALNKEYKDEWFFVITDRNRVRSYKKYGKSVDLRYLKQRLSKFRR